MARRQNAAGKAGSGLSQFGLLDIGMDDNESMEGSDDDMDLEAELAALNIGVSKPRAKKPPPAPGVNLDAMIAESLKDIPSDDDVGSDEDDPDLLNELNELTVDSAPPPPPRTTRPAPPPPGAAPAHSSMVDLLLARVANYTEAEANAKAKGESSRARRFSRGLKTLNDLLKQARAGRPIAEADIPPQVSTGRTEAPTSPPEAPSSPPTDQPTSPLADLPPDVPKRVESIAPKPSEPEDQKPSEAVDPEKLRGLQVILKRQQEFKAAALAHKQTDKALALELLKVVKQFDLVLSAFRAGQEMDLSELPTTEAVVNEYKARQRVESDRQGAAEPPPVSQPPEPTGLVTASTVEEALKQRLAVFQEQEANAKSQNNSSKQRRMGRIVKQYQQALSNHLSGKPFDVEELPTPPGFAPIPVTGGTSAAPAAPATPRAAPAAPRAAPAAPAVPRAAPAAPTPRPAQATRADKQILFLLQRQKEFREAALTAKKNGNLTEAKEYLRAALGFQPVLEAARGGLAVDLSSLPVPPTNKITLEHTFDIVSAEDCQPADQSSTISQTDEDVLTRLQQQLNSQLKLCLTNRDHYKAMGNVAETNRFENLAVSVKQDFDVVTVAKVTDQNPPKFHYENKQFSVIQCNTDLNENDLELTIVRGIAYNVPNPKEVDTYVKFEFPYPPDTPLSDKTGLVKDSNSPEYNSVFPLVIHRAARPCQRLFKRHAIKFQVFSRGGWFSKDALLGTVSVKLAPLESHVTLHEAYPLMDGRRPAGGSLEVKLRVRTPILQQEFDNTAHRWLVIDN